MSTQITTAMVQQYQANVMLLAQQKGSKLRGAVRVENVTGKTAFFDQIGATAARRRTSRHSDTPRMDTPHARRRVTMVDFDWADLLDKEDEARLLIDPKSKYAVNAANAMGRAMDEELVIQMLGTAYTGEAGATSTAFLAANQIAAGATAMTLAKVLQTKFLMDSNDVDPDGRYIATTAKQLQDMLNVTEVKSTDYNSVKALVNGDLNTFLGFNWIRLDGLRIDGTKILPVAATTRTCLAWQRDCVCLGLGIDMSTRISERADKNYATQVFNSMTIGATRMQEVGVVSIDCVEV
jgi:hypothetical protein